MVMRLDNIDILQAIDRRQEAARGVPVAANGLYLMEQMAGGPVTDQSLYGGFLQELRIAERAGLLTFTVDSRTGPAPDANPHYYLQLISDFALSVAGQDRARGRVVAQPFPDPSEDDARPISRSLLDSIGEAIAAEYGSGQIAQFLREAEIPPPSLALFGTDAGAILASVVEQGSEGRRAVRRFVGLWLDDRLSSGPSDDLRRHLIERFARSGWHVQDGNLVIGERARGQRVSAPVPRDARMAVLHPGIRHVSERNVHPPSRRRRRARWLLQGRDVGFIHQHHQSVGCGSILGGRADRPVLRRAAIADVSDS